MIELITSLIIASAFTIGLYSVFVSGSKEINREEVLWDVKNYATNSLEIITKNLQNAQNIQIDHFMGSDVIRFSNDGQPLLEYSIINNLVCENGIPIKLPGYQWLVNNQSLYKFEIDMKCLEGNISFYESESPNVQDNMYDIEITIDIESKIDENYETTYKAYNRVFAINKFSLL